MTDGRTIAITGVTGSQGGAAAKHLLAEGWRVRGLTRDAASAAARKILPAVKDMEATALQNSRYGGAPAESGSLAVTSN